MPKDFYCPITQDLMTIPVILIEDGRSYEKYALQSWLDHHNTSPMTNNVLKNRKFIINYNLKNAIEDFKAKRLKVNYFQELSSLFTIKSCRIPKFYQDHPKLKIKICLLGDSSVGKTTIAKKLQFDDRIQTVPTLGPDFTIFYVDHLYENQYTIIIQLQDIPGMERYGCVYDSHFRTCHGVILLIDITNVESLTDIKPR
ncbi:unnamed protein product [Didymodactylos carnosus]|uniref:U-box domain-containing protein n=1 Tax=Didymodactylos carnosus TaxID=1234261 RepID=A0A8S2R8V0_9BILA|nr:unnamed protein product [Didymodactylos carnosus]CAF4148453.1 unnamed protein product [Didymodactylos carnosus]